MTKIFNTDTLAGLKAAERFQSRMYNQFESVNVYAIGLSRVQIVALRPIVQSANRGQDPRIVPDRQA